MKKYIVLFYFEDKSIPLFVREIKGDAFYGKSIEFSVSGTKQQLANLKNNRIHGVNKLWWYSSKNFGFENYKKHKPQGIKIRFS